MNFFIMVQPLSLYLDRVRVMLTVHFKKFLKVVFGWASLPLEVVLGSCYEPLTGTLGFLTAFAVAIHYGNKMGSALLPLLATLSAFPSTFDGGLGERGPTIVGGRSHVT
jgi:hypothetical protein